MEAAPTNSPEAYRFYLLAISVTRTVLPVALAYLDQAIEADPDFARAYALRAQVNLNQLRFNRRLDDSRRADLEARVLQDLDDARALDPNLGFAHLVLGQFHGFNWRGADARAGYELAYALSPNDTNVLINYGYSFLSFIGEHQKAIELAQRAAELDPSVFGAPLAGVYNFAGDLERASAVFRTVLERDPANVRSLTHLGLIEIILGDEEEARRLLRLAELSGPDSLIFLPQIIYGYSRLGMQDDVERLVAQHEAVASGQRVAAANSALINLALGDHEEALRILESTAENKDPYDAPFPLMHIKWNLYRDPVLDQAEFAAVRERLGFTDL